MSALKHPLYARRISTAEVHYQSINKYCGAVEKKKEGAASIGEPVVEPGWVATPHLRTSLAVRYQAKDKRATKWPEDD
jgi:hypothetical protein